MSDPIGFRHTREVRRFVRAPRHRRVADPTAAVPLFEGLSRKERRFASQLLTTVAVPAGTLLAQEGTRGDEFFVVLEGNVEVYRDGAAIATRGPGSPLGEISLLEGGPRTATLIAKTPVSILVSSKQEFASLLDSTPRIPERLRAIAAERRAA